MARFQIACSLESNKAARERAVKNQYQRNTWKIDDQHGRTMIRNYGKRAEIILYHPVSKRIPPNKIDITVREYKRLERVYIGEFADD